MVISSDSVQATYGHSNTTTAVAGLHHGFDFAAPLLH